MNIESIQSTGFPPQKAATREAEPATIRQSPAKAEQAQFLASAQSQEEKSTNDPQTAKPTLDQAVSRLSDFVSLVRPEISFSTDEASGVQIVKVLDSQSREVIRQIPSEEAIQLAQALDKLQGLFVKDKA